MNAQKRQALAGEIKKLLEHEAGRPLKPKEIARALKVSTGDYRELKGLLRELVERGELYRVKRGRYAPPDKINLVVGRFEANRRGGGTVTPEVPGGPSIHVTADKAGTALSGDRVVCRVLGHGARPLPDGEIIRILERARTEIVGTLMSDEHVAFVRPEDPRIFREVLIPFDKLRGAKAGQIVTAGIVSWGEARSMMVGEIKEILGTPGDPGLDVTIVVKEYGLPLEFPDEIEKAASALPERPGERDFAGRLDLRDAPTFTIDPAEAKDFDDALSLRAIDGDQVEVGIHIADVGHYVTPGDPIDGEALSRATSVYLVDRVIPMLPEALSNRLCSLVPGEERLAFSVIVRMEMSGRVRSARFTPSVIRSRRRFAYPEVQALLDGKPPRDAADRPLLPLLRQLNEISERLIERRHARGSLDFDLPESRVILGEDGLPIDIQKMERLAAHRLVESFMLLANELVARRVNTARRPVLYRVHEPPDPVATIELRETLARFGYKLALRKDEPVGPRALQKVLQAAQGQPHEEIVNTLVLRSMKRALYGPEPLGHFGLATRDYTHFTSPIRRYPDLVVHRVLRALLTSSRSPYQDTSEMVRLGEHCSERERVAEEAERTSVELKKVQFMTERIGEEFEGRIVAVTSFGFFVELDRYHVSGLVHVNRIEDDYYQFRDDSFSLLGERTGRQFRLGDRVRVVVSRADIARKQIDFELVENGERSREASRSGRRGRPGQSAERSRPAQPTRPSRPSRRGKNRRRRSS